MWRSRACRTAMPATRAHALGVGDVGDQPVVVDLLERERNGDDAARRTRAPRPGWRRPAGVRPSSLAAHCARGAGQAQALQDRDVQSGEVRRRPSLVVAAGRRGRRAGAPGGQHGHDHRVGGAQRVEQLGFGGAQRGAVHRQRAAAGVPRSRRTAPRRRRCCRPAAGRGSRAPRPSGRRRRAAAPLQHAPGRHADGGVEARRRSAARCRTGTRAAGARFSDAALGQVDVRLQRRCPPGTVERPISSASGACSPPTHDRRHARWRAPRRCRPARRGSRRGCAPRRRRPRRAGSGRSSTSSRDGFAHR